MKTEDKTEHSGKKITGLPSNYLLKMTKARLPLLKSVILSSFFFFVGFWTSYL